MEGAGALAYLILEGGKWTILIGGCNSCAPVASSIDMKVSMFAFMLC